ncbi:MAG: alpha/beta fold hydrolase [Nocardiopsaceae bacterium]|nr:alpha/beta fold hydrolase [Nocardiopsaceae bacterium]
MRTSPGPARTRPRSRSVSLVMAALLALALGAAGCTSSAGSRAGSHASGNLANTGAQPGDIPGSGSTLHWHGCAGQPSGPGMKCASLRVPLDYSRPGGRHLTLALSMVPATAPKSQQQGVMLVNPGGPGASGLSLAAQVAQGVSPSVAADYDIVGFDPRGVGSSVPALHCDPSFFHGTRPDYIPSGPAAERVLINRAKTYAGDCEKRFGWMLPHMTTQDSARDMDAIRQAFGVRQVTYYAFSYGTYLGQVYATLFPGRVRRMVLDSTVDPNGVWWKDNIQQDYAFQARMTAFFGWTAKNDSAYHLGATTARVRAAWYRARDRLKAHPVSGPGGVRIAEDSFDDTFLEGGYEDQLWPSLASALSSYLNSGSDSGIVTDYQEYGAQNENENEFAVYNAVQCSDVNWPRSWAQWNKATKRVYKTAPFQAWDNAWYNAACAFWPVKGPAKPLRIDGKGLPPILMLQGTLDAATPYAGARDARRLLPSARMVVVQGSGNHGQSLQYPPDQCVQKYLNDYLSAGTVPGRPGLVNATCPATPAPVPGG